MRALLVAIVVASVLSTGVGFALGRLSDPPPANAQAQAATAADTRYLKSIDRQLKLLRDDFDFAGKKPGGFLYSICRNTRPEGTFSGC